MSKAKKEVLNKPINFVCRNDLKFNHARVFIDRKKSAKSGYAKHKKVIYDGFFVLWSIL